jgi:hypothetical protein
MSADVNMVVEGLAKKMWALSTQSDIVGPIRIKFRVKNTGADDNEPGFGKPSTFSTGLCGSSVKCFDFDGSMMY